MTVGPSVKKRAVAEGARFARVLRQDPRNVEAWEQLGRTCLTLERIEDAERAFRAGTDLAPGSAAMWAGLGEALLKLRNAPEAQAAYERALALGGGVAGHHLGLGHCLRAFGEGAEAAACYRQAIALDPGSGVAWYSLFGLLEEQPRDDELVALVSAADSSPIMGYAYAACLDRLERYDDAFASYAGAARAWLAQHPYDPAAITRFAAIARGLVKPTGGGDVTENGCLRRPIFIVGMPRSGSTLVERILATHPRAIALDEPPYLGEAIAQFGPYPGMMVEADDTSLLAGAQGYRDKAAHHAEAGTAVLLDKNPNNWWFVPFILRAMPDALVIDARREAMDACTAAFIRLFPKGFEYSYDLTHLASFRRAYERAMDGWRAAAPGRIHLIDYETLVADPEPAIHVLLDFCRLDFDPVCLAPHRNESAVHTASTLQVRRPINSGSVGRWRRFERHLEPLRRALG